MNKNKNKKLKLKLKLRKNNKNDDVTLQYSIPQTHMYICTLGQLVINWVKVPVYWPHTGCIIGYNIQVILNQEVVPTWC